MQRGLKKIQRTICVTNDAYWFARELHERIERPLLETAAIVDFSNKEETIRWLEKNNSNFGWMYVPEEVSLARACGHYLPSVRFDGKVIGYIKIARERAYVLDYEGELRLPSSDAFVYDTFVLPEYRGKSIGTFLISEVMAFLKQKGYRRLWCHIPTWNAASVAAFSKSGFRRIAHVRYFRVLGCRFFSIAPERLIRRAASR